MLEMIGYLGSALVVVSMPMSLVIKLRVINTIGSGIFAAYARMIHSYPTALMNGFLIGINIYNLIKLTQKDRSYDLVEGAQGEGLLRYLLDYYREDIRTYFPDFSANSGADRVYIVCGNGNPAGVLLGTGLPKNFAGTAGLLHAHLPGLLHRSLPVFQAAF